MFAAGRSWPVSSAIAFEAGAAEFAAGCAAFAFDTGAEFAFESPTADGAVVSVTGSATVSSTETPPRSAGSEIRNAETMNTDAATIVIFARIVAVPRGLKAELEILLVKSAPASVLPGCKRTDAIRTMHEIKNNV